MSNIGNQSDKEKPTQDLTTTYIPEKINEVSEQNSHLLSNDNSNNAIKNANRPGCPGRDYNWNTTHFFPDLRLVNLSGFLKTDGRKFEYKSNESQKSLGAGKDSKKRDKTQKNLNTTASKLRKNFENSIGIKNAEQTLEKKLTYSGQSFTYCKTCGEIVESHVRNHNCHDERSEKLTHQSDTMTDSSSSLNSQSQSSSSTISFAVASSDDSELDDMSFGSFHKSSKSWHALSTKGPSLVNRNDVVRSKFNIFSNIKQENYLKKMKFFGLLENETKNNPPINIERQRDISDKTSRLPTNGHSPNHCEIVFKGYDQYSDERFKKDVGEKVVLSDDDKEILLKTVDEKNKQKTKINDLKNYSEKRFSIEVSDVIDDTKNVKNLHETNCMNNEFFSNIDDYSDNVSGGDEGEDERNRSIKQGVSNYISTEFESDSSFYNENVYNDLDDENDKKYDVDEEAFYNDCGNEKSDEIDEVEDEKRDIEVKEKQDQFENNVEKDHEKFTESPKTIGKLNSEMIKMFEIPIQNSAGKTNKKTERKIETNYTFNDREIETNYSFSDNMTSRQKQMNGISSKELKLNKKPPIHPLSKAKNSNLLLEGNSIKNDDETAFINENSQGNVYRENERVSCSNSYINPLYQNELRPKNNNGENHFNYENMPKTLENDCLDDDIKEINKLKKGTVKKFVNVFEVDSNKVKQNVNVEKIIENSKTFSPNKSIPLSQQENRNRKIEVVQKPQQNYKEEYYDFSKQRNGVVFSVTGYSRINNTTDPQNSIGEHHGKTFIPIYNNERRDIINWSNTMYGNPHMNKRNLIPLEQNNDISKRKPITNLEPFEHEFPSYDNLTNNNMENKLKQQYQLHLQLSSLHLEGPQQFQAVRHQSPNQHCHVSQVDRKPNNSTNIVNSKTSIKRNTEIFKRVNKSLDSRPFQQTKNQVICLDQNTQTYKKQKNNPEIEEENNKSKPLKKHGKFSLKDTLKKQCRESMMNAIKKSKSFSSQKQQKKADHPKQKSEIRKQNRFQFIPKYQQMLLLQEKRQNFLQNQQKQKLINNFENLTVMNDSGYRHETKQDLDSKTTKKQLIKRKKKSNITQIEPTLKHHLNSYRDQTHLREPQTNPNHITIYYGYPEPKLDKHSFDGNEYFIEIKPAIDKPDLCRSSVEKLTLKSSSQSPLTIDHEASTNRRTVDKPLSPSKFPNENQVVYRTAVFSRIESPDNNKNSLSFSPQNHCKEKKEPNEKPFNMPQSRNQTFIMNRDNFHSNSNHIYLNNRSAKNQYHNFNLIFNSKNLDNHNYQYDHVVSNNTSPTAVYPEYKNPHTNNFDTNDQMREYTMNKEPTSYQNHNATPLTISVIENQMGNELNHKFKQPFGKDESFRNSEKIIIPNLNNELKKVNRFSNVEATKSRSKSTSVNIKLQNYDEDFRLQNHENHHIKPIFRVLDDEPDDKIAECVNDDDKQMTVAQVKAKLFGENEEKARSLLGINKKNENLKFSKNEKYKKTENINIHKQEKTSEKNKFQSFSASKSFDGTFGRPLEFSKHNFALELSQKAEALKKKSSSYPRRPSSEIKSSSVTVTKLQPTHKSNENLEKRNTVNDNIKKNDSSQGRNKYQIKNTSIRRSKSIADGTLMNNNIGEISRRKSKEDEEDEEDEEEFNVNNMNVSSLINLFEKSKSESSLIDKVKSCNQDVCNVSQRKNNFKKSLNEKRETLNVVKNINNETKKSEEKKHAQNTMQKIQRKNSKCNKKKSFINLNKDNSETTLDKIFIENQMIRHQMKASRKSKQKTHSDFKEQSSAYHYKSHKDKFPTELKNDKRLLSNVIRNNATKQAYIEDSEITDCTDTTIDDVLNSNRLFDNRYKSNLQYFVNESEDDLVISHYQQN